MPLGTYPLRDFWSARCSLKYAVTVGNFNGFWVLQFNFTDLGFWFWLQVERWNNFIFSFISSN